MAKLGRMDFTFLSICIFSVLFAFALILATVKSNAQSNAQLTQVSQIGNITVWRIVDNGNILYLAERPGNLAITNK